MPSLANKFMDLFLVDYNGDLIDVPIKITNVKDQNGNRVNEQPLMENWVLVRRFFLFDTVSGIEDG
jgi:hypothetical protein